MANLSTYDNEIQVIINVYDKKNLISLKENFDKLTQEQIYNYLIEKKEKTQSIEDIQKESNKLFNLYKDMTIDLSNSYLEGEYEEDLYLTINIDYFEEAVYEFFEGYDATMDSPAEEATLDIVSFTSKEDLDKHINDILKILNTSNEMYFEYEDWNFAMNKEEIESKIIEYLANDEPDEDMYRYDDY